LQYYLCKSFFLQTINLYPGGHIDGEAAQNLQTFLPREIDLVISTWKSLDSWKEWEASKQRKDIQEKIDALLKDKTECIIYFYGE